MMLSRRLLLLILICCSAFTLNAAEDKKTYCNLLSKIQTGMNIEDVFVLLGPPHTFGQPPNLDMAAVYNKKSRVTEPQNQATDTKTQRDLIRQAINNDPILQAFVKASPNSTNVLIWKYDDNKYSIAVQVKGPKVVDVKSNFSC